MSVLDVAVIGSGVIGQAIAFELVTRGASVTMFDCRGAGLGATQASAGMLVPYAEGIDHPLLPIAARSLDMYDAFVDRVTRDAGVGPGYCRTGSLQVATSDESLGELKEVAVRVRAAGVVCELLDSSGARDAEPHLMAEVAGALLIRSHGFVVATDLSGALSAVAIKHGARVRVPARVTRLARRDDLIDIQLDHDRVSARQVILAAGSWSGQIAIEGVPSLPVRPVRGQLLQLGWDEPGLKRIIWGPRCYLVPVNRGTILVGATVEDVGFDERTTVAGVRDLLDAACDLVPQLWQASLVGTRVGLRPGTEDELPIIGRSTKMPGLTYATGHYRNGVLLAPWTARAVADLVLENRADPLLAITSPQRFGEY